MVPLQKVDKLEDMHRLVLLFLWLSQRFPTLFIDKDSAMEVKALVEKRINQELVNVERANSFSWIDQMGMNLEDKVVSITCK